MSEKAYPLNYLKFKDMLFLFQASLTCWMNQLVGCSSFFIVVDAYPLPMPQ